MFLCKSSKYWEWEMDLYIYFLPFLKPKKKEFRLNMLDAVFSTKMFCYHNYIDIDTNNACTN